MTFLINDNALSLHEWGTLGHDADVKAIDVTGARDRYRKTYIRTHFVHNYD